MNRDEIMKLEAGRELDTLVAEKVMGLTADKEHCPYCGAEMWIGALRSRCSSCSEWRYGWYKNYSDDISAAWEVIEKLETHPDQILFSLVRKGAEMHLLKWCAEFRKCLGSQKYYYAEAKTAPLAICRAALLAVMDG
jgi:hypothetical protein